MRYRLVPEELADGMIDASRTYHGQPFITRRQWAAMLASSPVFEPSDACVEKVKDAVAVRLAAEFDTCANPTNDPQGECADDDCWCARFAKDIARAAIEAFQKAVAEGV